MSTRPPQNTPVFLARAFTMVPMMMRADPMPTVGLRPYRIETQEPKKDAIRPGKYNDDAIRPSFVPVGVSKYAFHSGIACSAASNA